MNYCSHCGSDQLIQKIPKTETEVRTVCQNCETVHYINPNMVVGCIVENKGQILLAKRGIEPRKGFWNLPCGFLEMNENVEDGAIREVYEETGLKVSISRLHTLYNVVHSGQVYLIFLAKASNRDFTTNIESTEIGFFSEEQIPWDEIAFSANTFALKKYFENKSGRPENVHLGSTLNK
ncbi:MAG: NUDIX hydrolase [Schleiferiaceae bacterium]|jgi:ADP-ribose pyrophosphatase YjhB (NUDIX family)|nr:NUDIX hydrolase [Schleiferiaceae bacterium]